MWGKMPFLVAIVPSGRSSAVDCTELTNLNGFVFSLLENVANVTTVNWKSLPGSK